MSLVDLTFIYLYFFLFLFFFLFFLGGGVNVAFNTVQVISQQVVLWAEVTSTYSCQSSVL